MSHVPKIECDWCNCLIKWCNVKNVWQTFWDLWKENHPLTAFSCQGGLQQYGSQQKGRWRGWISPFHMKLPSHSNFVPRKWRHCYALKLYNSTNEISSLESGSPKWRRRISFIKVFGDYNAPAPSVHFTNGLWVHNPNFAKKKCVSLTW